MTEPTAPSRSPDPDQDLVRAARQGSYEAFEQLVAKHEQSIYALAMRIVRHSQDAQEVVQETFLSVVEHLKDFREGSAFRTWLVRIATNHALKLLRKRKGLTAMSLDASGEEGDLPHPQFIAEWREEPSQITQQRETRRLLDEALNDLDEKYRVVFVLRDVEGLSTEETAETLGISVSNAKVRLLRARLMLRERLTKVFGDEAKRLVGDHKHE